MRIAPVGPTLRPVPEATFGWVDITIQKACQAIYRPRIGTPESRPHSWPTEAGTQQEKSLDKLVLRHVREE